MATDKSKPGAKAPRIKWNTEGMASHYANVCNVSSTQEEMVFVFGVNQAWDAKEGELEIQLSNRIIMSPFSAKRLYMLLGKVIGEFESRYGELNVSPKTPADTAGK